MSTKIQGAVLLTCLACAAPLAAQSPDVDPQSRRQVAATQQRRQGAARRNGDAPAEASQVISHTARLMPGGTLDLRNVMGNVTVKGGSGGREVRIEATKRVMNVAPPRARTVLNAILVEVAERGGNVEVTTMHPAGFAGRAAPNRPVVSVDYVVVLPPDSNVNLRSTSGTLRVQNVTGDQFELNTLSGDIEMQDLRGRMLDLHSVTGNMRLLDIVAERALVETMAGNLEYAGQLMPTGRYKLRSHEGRVRVTPGDNAGFDLDAMSVTGNVLSDFVLRQLRPREVTKPRRIRGTYGDAGAAVTVSTFSGDIEIVKR